jgi:hypothetical protein
MAFTKTRIAIGALTALSILSISSTAFASGGPHSVKITSTPPSDPDVGGTYEVAATGSPSGNPVVIGVGEGSSSVCTITPTKAGTASVAFVGPGTCVIYAYQPNSDNHPSGQAVQVISGIDDDKYAPEHGHGFHGHKHGGQLLGFSNHSHHDGGGKGSNGGEGAPASWSSHSAALASATLPAGTGIQSSSGPGISSLVGIASVALALSGMFVLRGRRRRSRTTGGAA